MADRTADVAMLEATILKGRKAAHELLYEDLGEALTRVAECYTGWQVRPEAADQIEEALEELRDRIAAMNRFYDGVYFVERALDRARAREVRGG